MNDDIYEPDGLSPQPGCHTSLTSPYLLQIYSFYLKELLRYGVLFCDSGRLQGVNVASTSLQSNIRSSFQASLGTCQPFSTHRPLRWGPQTSGPFITKEFPPRHGLMETISLSSMILTVVALKSIGDHSD